jgi:hypothetical protein
MNRRERVLQTLNHRQPDRLPIDFGSTAVSGMHVSCVEALRGRLGLEKRPVKVHEPYQMLGLLEDDLLDALDIDAAGTMPIKTLFGFPVTNWKEWRTPWGQDVLVPRDFQTTRRGNGVVIYPEGDTSAAPSGYMPEGSFFFDTIIRQPPIDEEKLDLRDNLEEFRPLSQSDLAFLKSEVESTAASGRAVVSGIGGTAFGDIALVPAPFLKAPKCSTPFVNSTGPEALSDRPTQGLLTSTPCGTHAASSRRGCPGCPSPRTRGAAVRR